MTGKRHPDNEDMGQRYTKTQEIRALRDLAHEYEGGYIGMLLTPDLLNWFEEQVHNDWNPDIFDNLTVTRLRLQETEGDLNRAKQIIEDQQQTINRKSTSDHDFKLTISKLQADKLQLEQALATVKTELADKHVNFSAFVVKQGNEATELRKVIDQLKLKLFDLEHPEFRGPKPPLTDDEEWDSLQDLEDRDDEDEASHEW